MNPAGDQFFPAGAAPAGGGRSVRRQVWWGGLLLVAVLAAVGGGASGVALAVGLVLLVVGLIAVVRGRVTWAYLHTRARGGAALGASMTLLAIGGGTADPAPTAGGAPPAVSSPSSSVPGGATSSPIPSSPATTTTTAAAAEGTALAAVSGLPVKGRSAKTGYSRASFGPTWFDADRNGCDTRNDILRRDLVDRTMKNPCKVLAGTAAPDPYTGTQIRFVSGGADEIDVDHVVALADAWQKGAAGWAEAKRLAFATDPVNLLAVGAGTNRSKGDGDAATWLPPNKPYRCEYVARQVTVKLKYGLWVTAAEQHAMRAVLGACPRLPVPPPGSAPTTARPPTQREATRPAPPRLPAPALTQPPEPAKTLVQKPTARPEPRPGVVHPGSFCSPAGARGVTVNGTSMVCSSKPGDSRARWQRG